MRQRARTKRRSAERAARAAPSPPRAGPSSARLVTLSILLFCVVRVALVLTAPPYGAPDDERYVARLRLRADAAAPPASEALLVCMPTVARPGGAEYVSNAVKSFRAATARAAGAGRLAVFGMDAAAGVRAEHGDAWGGRVFRGSGGGAWLEVFEREGEVRAPRKLTHGDGKERVAWRAKEALDYAEVLERCAAMARGRYVAVVQDDVLFRKGFAGVVAWLDRNMGGAGWCGAALFDLPDGGKEGVRELMSSNLVGRVYDVSDGGEEVRKLVGFIRRRFDASPVDWLVGDYCRGRGRKTFTVVPSLLRHRGKTSSFAGNDREGTLT